MFKMKIHAMVYAITILVATSTSVHAATKSYAKSSDYGYSSSSSSREAMMVDASLHYMRSTRPENPTDTAARFSIGGMFTRWIGLDLVGMYATKSKDYLVGSNLRIMPTDWFFIKGGAGAYSDKQTRDFKVTPLVGTGIQASLGSGYYLVSEFSYFERDNDKNVSFGGGLGMMF